MDVKRFPQARHRGRRPSRRLSLRGKADVYTLLGQWDSVATNREMHPGISVVAALKRGVTLAAARAEIDSITARLAETYPNSNKGHGVNVVPLTQVIVGDVRPTLLVLLGAVTFVLLIACANVANLLLARCAARRREIAIHAAVGASRARVTGLVLTERLMISLTGGLAGLVIAKWGALAVVAASPGGLGLVAWFCSQP